MPNQEELKIEPNQLENIGMTTPGAQLYLRRLIQNLQHGSAG